MIGSEKRLWAAVLIQAIDDHSKNVKAALAGKKRVADSTNQYRLVRSPENEIAAAEDFLRRPYTEFIALNAGIEWGEPQIQAVLAKIKSGALRGQMISAKMREDAA